VRVLMRGNFGKRWPARGAPEGAQRLLDMFDRASMRVSSFMIGETIRRYPALAREIVARGHEGGGRALRRNSTCPGTWSGSSSARVCRR